MKKLLVFLLFTSYTLSSQIYKEQDKQLHFAAGLLSGSIGYTFIYNKTQNKKKAMIGGIATSILAGVAKETYDSTKGNNFDERDILATALGGITVNITIPIFTNKKKN